MVSYRQGSTSPLLRGNVSTPFAVCNACFPDVSDLLGAREQQVPLPGTVFTEQQDCPAIDSGALLSPAFSMCPQPPTSCSATPPVFGWVNREMGG